MLEYPETSISIISQNIFEDVKEDVDMSRLEDQCRSEPETGVAASSSLNSTVSQFPDQSISLCSRRTIERHERSWIMRISVISQLVSRIVIFRFQYQKEIISRICIFLNPFTLPPDFLDFIRKQALQGMESSHESSSTRLDAF